MKVDEVLKRIETLCEYAGSLSKFARSIGYTPGYISQVKNRKRPPSERLIKKMGGKKKYTFNKIPDFRN